MIKKTFLKELYGKDIFWFEFENKKGSTARVTNLGGIIASLKTKDRNGVLTETLLGFEDIDKYIAGHPNFGSTIGRVAGRIKCGKFTINGKEYTVPATNGNNAIHGGPVGFDKCVWDAEINGESLILTLVSPDGDQGFPGELKVDLEIRLTDDDELVLSYTAVSKEDTIINLTNHSYFTLNGAKGDALDHLVKIEADKYLEVDDELIPTGRILDAAGTAVDFSDFRRLGEKIYDESVQRFKGYDVNYVIKGEGFRKIAEFVCEENGRTVETYSDQPVLQIYTANYIGESNVGNDGIQYKPYYACCFETQNYPDGINQDNFPSCILKKGEVFKTKTVYKFFAK